MLSVAVVARQIGVAPATLRTWARRYGLGPSEHAAGAHRRYAPDDVARLRAMRRLTVQGMSPADAARVVRSKNASGLGDPDAENKEQLADRDGSDAVALTARAVGGTPTPRIGHRGGGRVLAMPGGSAESRGLAAAAMALDSVSVHRVVRNTIARVGVMETWKSAIRPVLLAVGERWHATGECIEVEHLLSAALTSVFGELAGRAPEPPHGRPILLAGAPGEAHGLPLSVLAAALAERGTGTRTLGSLTPAPALAAAVRRTGPCAVVVLSLSARTADVRILRAVPVTRPPLTLLAAGPGWSSQACAPATVVRDLGAAVQSILVAAGMKEVPVRR